MVSIITTVLHRLKYIVRKPREPLKMFRKHCILLRLSNVCLIDEFGRVLRHSINVGIYVTWN
jgi:hypothetical protein